MPSPTLRIAFVVQRYGLEVNGGAELCCRWTAEHLSQYAEVDVFTTCAQDYMVWNNVYPSGDETLNGVLVHRFAVDAPRSPTRFAEITEKTLYQPHSYLDELAWMNEQGPISTKLLAEIERRREDFDVFVFFTYLYATTYYGLQLVPDRAMLVPTAHDEPTLYLPIFRPIFHMPRYMLYLTETERGLVHTVFQNHGVPSAVVGSGINVPEASDEDRFRNKYGIDGDFILYVGRVDASKNVGELLSYFQRYKASANSTVKLLLLGKGPYSVTRQADIIPLGFVSEADKFDALSACSLLVLPSRYESLSMVLLEAWLMGKPVLVNGACDVLRQQCLRSDGGLYYEDYEEFRTALDLLMQNPNLRRRMGRKGRAFTLREYSWESVERKYLHAISEYLGARRGNQSR
ncbi:MAG: glycosyltransferase family 4 protein [Anaerolineae bacterium]|nr:glycosyltransferase family 4 protein [Anaerolineae bacterium]